ncbi:MAG TPA: hypothetical protein VG188_12775 [Solirubrobacteraceae bacterium]|nr:hypothetical protein [Solirubrobacteraceae bacterium]
MTRVQSPKVLRRTLVLTMACVVSIALSAALASAASAANLTGTWQGAYHCEVGWCAGEDFPATTELYEAPGCADVIGSNGGEQIVGTLLGSTFSSTSETGGYKSEGTATLSADGNHLEGKGHDSNGTSGTSTSTRVSSSSSIAPYSGCKMPSGEAGKPEEKGEEAKKTPQGVHSTGLTVMCDYDVLSSQDTCTATVADSSGTPTSPTGAVTFANASGGFFAFGTTCALHSSPSAPSTGYCSVQYGPGAGAGFPNIAASYAGDPTHAAATGSTRFIVPGGDPASYDESGPGSGYPNELSVEVQTPAPKTEVQAGVNAGETKAPASSGKHLRAIEDPDIVPEMREEVAEREREERYPDIVPTMRKEVEEREIQYEKDIREMRTEINEMQRARAGLNAQATDELTRVVQDDSILLKQIAQQTASPGLKKDAASQQVLGKLSKESSELQKEIGEALRIQHEQLEGVVRATGSSLAAASNARAAKHKSKAIKPRGRLVALGHARVLAAAGGKVKLHVRLSRTLLKRLAHGRKTVNVNLRILMVVPSNVASSGLPIGMVRTVTLHAVSRKRRR